MLKKIVKHLHVANGFPRGETYSWTLQNFKHTVETSRMMRIEKCMSCRNYLIQKDRIAKSTLFETNVTCATLARRYKARVRLRLESSSAKMDNPASEPARILLHHAL